MQALALEVGFSETVFVFPPESGGTVRDPDLHAVLRAAVRRPPDTGHRLRARRAAAAGGDRARDRTRPRARRPRARRERPDRLRADGAAGAVGESVSATDELFAASGWTAPSFRSRCTTTERRSSSSPFPPRPSWRRCSRPRRGSRPSASPAPPASRARERRGRHGCSGPGARTRPPVPPRGRSRVTSPATAASPGARRSRSRRAAAIGRPSTLYARADGGEGLIDRVEVGGQAVTVARGEFRL